MKKLLLLEPKDYWVELGVLDSLTEKYHIDYGVFSLGRLDAKLRNRVYCAIVTCIYHSPISLAATFIAKRNNIPVFYFMDGIGDISNFLGNQYTLGSGVRQLLPPLHDITFCVDNPTAVFVESMNAGAAVYECRRVYGDGLNKLSGGKMYDFLVTTANTPFYDDGERARYVEIINKLISLLKEKKVSYCFRIFDENLIDCLDVGGCANIVDVSLEECLLSCSCVVTTPSSVVIMAAQLDMPVATVEYRDTPILVRGGWSLHMSMDMNKCIDSMLSLDKDRLLFQSSLLADGSDFDTKIEKYIKVKENEVVDLAYNAFGRSIFSFSLEYYFRAVLRSVKKNRNLSAVISFLKKSGLR